ncbi:MBL fold metallo-hydrolase [bacterium SCSIO 12741]|nr:MBL fold metallo-hydrolase [bacterium SCSIO 12741]
MKVEQLYTGCLAEAAYYIESDGEAAIIDPLRDTAPYLRKAEEDNAKFKYIFETHFHADFVSGHLDMAQKTGAQIVYGPNATAEFDFLCAEDNQEFKIGKVTLVLLHTPGHTMESSTFLLRDENGKDVALFTGDTLFIGDVGRPDLAVKSDLSKEDLAGYLFDSLRNKIMPLSDDLTIYPGHGAGSACGKNLSTETVDTLGNQKATNYALRPDMSREEFVKEVTDGIAPPPQYFPKNAVMNKKGYDSLDKVMDRGNRALTADEFEKLANDAEALILDTRNKEAFAEAHVPGSVFIGLDGNFAPWVGALIEDLQQPILFLADAGKEEEVITRLSRVGYDHTIGYLNGGVEAWKNAGKEADSVPSVEANDLGALIKDGGTVVDVRKPSEFDAEHVEDAANIPLDYINANMDKITNEPNQYVHCKSGYRSMVFISILKARGFHNHVNVNGGIDAILKTDIPVTAFACSSQS